MSQFNSRILEEDVAPIVGSTSPGDSEVIDLDGASKFSCQAVYDISEPGPQDFDAGAVAESTFTFLTKANTDSGDYLVVYDTNGLAWAAAADITGSDPEPTGAIWVAIPSARKVMVDLSTRTTATQVATSFKNALNALVDVTFEAISGANIVTCTSFAFHSVTDPIVRNADDTTDGTIVTAVVTPGIDSDINLDDDEITIVDHGYPEGFKVQLTTTGTLPQPLLELTDYFIIVIDEDTIQFAASLEDSLEAIPIDLVDIGGQGVVNTVTGVPLDTSIVFKKSNNGVDWIAIQAATDLTVDGSVMLEQADVSYRYFMVTKDLTAGVVELQANLLIIGDAE